MSIATIELFKDIITTKDMERFNDNADKFIGMLFETRGTFEEKLISCFPQNQTQQILGLLEADSLQTDDSVVMKRFVSGLKEELKTIPVLQMAFPLEIPKKHLRRVAEWFFTNLGHKVVLDISLEDELIGGLAIYQNGVYKDYSLRKKLDDMSERGELKLANLLTE